MKFIQQVYKSEDYNCGHNREIFDKLKFEFPDLRVEDVELTSQRGKKLTKLYKLSIFPSVIVNKKYFASGGVDEDKLRELLKTF